MPNPAARRLAYLFPDRNELRQHLTRKVGRELSPEELEELEGPFLSDVQRAYLNASGCYFRVYPKRQKFLKKHGLL